MKISRVITVLIGILILGGVLRGLRLAELAREPDFRRPAVDSGFHDYWARGIATGDWKPPAFYRDPEIRTTPFNRPPGYPYFLAGIYTLFGHDYTAARVVQFALGLLSCLLAFLFARRWLGDRAALIAAALMAVYAPFIYYEGELLEPALVTALALGTLHALGSISERLSPARGALAGLVMGLFAITRPNVLVFAPIALLWIVWVARRRNARPLATIAALIATLAAVVVPVSIRNYVVSRELVPISSNFGINLAMGLGKSATGRIVDLPGVPRDWTCFDYAKIVRDLGRRLGRQVTHSQSSSYFASEALRHARSDPSQVIRLTWQKTLLFWGPAEVSHDKEDYYERAHSPVLRSIPITFALALSLAVAGSALMVLNIRRPKAKPKSQSAMSELLVLVIGFVGVYFVSFLPFSISAPYRIPVVPFLLILGAYGVDRAFQARSRETIAWLIAAIALFALTSHDFAGFEPNLAKWRFDRGAAYSRLGKTREAAREYELAVAANPRYPNARTNLAGILLSQNQPGEAIDHLERALNADPANSNARSMLGLAYLRSGKPKQAIAELESASLSDPENPNIRFHLGLAHDDLGDQAHAAAHYEAALELKPAWPEVANNLAWILATARDPALRDPRRAVDLAEAAVAADPHDAAVLDTLRVARKAAGL